MSSPVTDFFRTAPILIASATNGMLPHRFAVAPAGWLLFLVALSQSQAGWRALGPFGGAVSVVQTDPHHPNTLVAATSNALLFRSRDGAQTWMELPFPAELRSTLHALVLDPANADRYFVGLADESPAYSGVFRTRNAGVTWEQLPGLRGKKIWSLAFFSGDSRILAAGAQDGIYLTQDSGESWARISPFAKAELHPVVSLAFDPGDSQVIYAGTPHLPWKTTDGGITWHSIRTGMLDDSDVFSIQVDASSPERLFASACSGIYRSIDGGSNWVRLNVPKSASDRTYFVAQDSKQNSMLFAGTTHGLVRSLDSGDTWSKVWSGQIRGIAFDIAHSNRVFLATDESGILRSDDGGSTFTEMNLGLCNRRLSPLVESAGSLYTVGSGGSLLRLTKDASEWESLGVPDGQVVRQIVPVPGAPDRLYAAGGNSILMSTDAGRTWMGTSRPSTTAPLTAVLPSRESNHLLVASEAGLFSSDDAGLTWDTAMVPAMDAPIRAFIPVSPQWTAAIGGAHLFLSSDGLTWSSVSLPTDRLEINGLVSTGSDGLLAATSAGLLRSDDFGRTWRPVAGVLGGTSIRAICKHPTLKDVYFAAAFDAVYESRDGGRSWQCLTPKRSGIDSVVQLLVMPSQPGRLFALTERAGVFSLDRPAADSANLPGRVSQ